MVEPLRIIIIGDTRIYCDGIANLLRQDHRCVVAGVEYSADAALRVIPTLPVSLALVDTGMPNACDVIRGIAHLRADLKVVALAVDERSEAIIQCAEAGAVGYVSRQSSIEELILALQATFAGELRCSSRVAGQLMCRLAARGAFAPARASLVEERLTQREREVVDLIALRMSNKQIAHHLGIEFSTVKNHVHHILEKLNARRRGEILSRRRALKTV